MITCLLQSRADQAVELKMHKSTNIGVNRGLLACLKSREWLNDEVMNIFIGLLQVISHSIRDRTQMHFEPSGM